MKVSEVTKLAFDFGSKKYLIEENGDLKLLTLLKKVEPSAICSEMHKSLIARMTHCREQIEQKEVVFCEPDFIGFSDGTHFSAHAYNAMESLSNILSSVKVSNPMKFIQRLNAFELIQLLKAESEFGGRLKNEVINIISNCIACNYKND